MNEINDLTFNNTELQDNETQKIKDVKKAEKKALKIQKKNEKHLRKSNKKREKVEQIIRSLNAKLEYINNLILLERKDKKIKKLEKKKTKIEARIEKFKISIISKTQRSLVDKLNVKVMNIRRWGIFLFVLIFIIICVSAIWLYSKHEESGYYNRAYNSVLYDKSMLESKISSLESEISTLESENSTLESKAIWFDRRCKLVIADEGSLYKTYHTYDCDKWRGHSLWIYNKEQVRNNTEYTKCPDCNEE